MLLRAFIPLVIKRVVAAAHCSTWQPGRSAFEETLINKSRKIKTLTKPFLFRQIFFFFFFKEWQLLMLFIFSTDAVWDSVTRATQTLYLEVTKAYSAF